MKETLFATPTLRLINFSKTIVVDIDSLDQVVRAVILQSNKDKLHPVEYLSRKYYPVEKNTPVHEKELLESSKLAKSGDTTLMGILL